MPKNLRLALLIVALLTAAIVGAAIISARTPPASNSCASNLRALDGAKELWAAESHKTTNDVPRWEDLMPYLHQKPLCPQGGTYTLGRVGQPPRCSLGGTHTLSE
jgi:hypothetical protein